MKDRRNKLRLEVILKQIGIRKLAQFFYLACGMHALCFAQADIDLTLKLRAAAARQDVRQNLYLIQKTASSNSTSRRRFSLQNQK